MPAKDIATPAVSFVIAGPGEVDLLTVRALRLLQTADIVIADSEVAGLANEVASGEVQVALDVNGAPLSLAARTKIILTERKAGKTIARLMSGDPVIDGRLTMETSAIAKSGEVFEVAAGVSPLTAVPAHAGLSLTSGRTREVRIIDADSPTVEWSTHIDPTVTLVIHNAAERANEIAKALLKAGRDPQTPVVIVRDGATLDQRSLHATLETLTAAMKLAKHTGPGLVIVGESAAQRTEWFESRALHGWKVLVPRTKDSTENLQEMLHTIGAVPFEVPTMSVEPPRTPQQMERAIHGLVSGRFEWVIFTSVNAVRAIRERFAEIGLDARSLSGIRIAAIGNDTVDALIDMGVRPDLVPDEEQTSAALLEVWPEFDEIIDPINRIFLPRADLATETLVAGLTSLGWEVEDVTAYRTVRAAPPHVETREAIKSGGFDAVVFTSSSTVRNLVGIAGKPHATSVIACIGPATAKTAQEHGLRVDVLPEEPTMTALVAALAAHGKALREEAAQAGAVGWRPSRKRSASRRRAT
ncbi:MAG: uroporphyrinogen-III synthase [Actinomycetales bacterium]|nr:uroporphyrinogen-III synthase [Actinomycetales bacterium]